MSLGRQLFAFKCKNVKAGSPHFDQGASPSTPSRHLQASGGRVRAPERNSVSRNSASPGGGELSSDMEWLNIISEAVCRCLTAAFFGQAILTFVCGGVKVEGYHQSRNVAELHHTAPADTTSSAQTFYLSESVRKMPDANVIVTGGACVYLSKQLLPSP